MDFSRTISLPIFSMGKDVQGRVLILHECVCIGVIHCLDISITTSPRNESRSVLEMKRCSAIFEDICSLQCSIILIYENFSAPTKSTPGKPPYPPALYQLKSTITKLLVSFRFQVEIIEGQAEETAWSYGCNR